MGEAAEILEHEQECCGLEMEDVAFLSTGILDHIWKFGSD